MSANNGFVIECGPPDARGMRTITAILGKTKCRDKFDPADSFKRSKFRENVISAFGFDDSAHEGLEQKILAAADTDNSEIAVANVVTAADLDAKPVHWFWDLYFPAGAITDLSGDPNEGKSTLATDLIARNSQGLTMPPHHFPAGDPRDSLLIMGEDDAERTTVPRLLSAGADLARVHLLRNVTVCDETRFVQLPLDLPLIERVIADKKINFVVVDVLSALPKPAPA